MQTKKMFLAFALSLVALAPCFANPNISPSAEPKIDELNSIDAKNDDAKNDDAKNDDVKIDETTITQINETQLNDTLAVEQASRQFYASLNAMFTGNVAPMQEVWSHANDVTCMGPAGGSQVGWQQVNDQWEEQAGMRLGGQIEATDIHVIVGGDLASVTCLEVGENLDADGGPEEVSIRATNLFRKENGQWKMISHHTDLLPFLETDSGSAE